MQLSSLLSSFQHSCKNKKQKTKNEKRKRNEGNYHFPTNFPTIYTTVRYLCNEAPSSTEHPSSVEPTRQVTIHRARGAGAIPGLLELKPRFSAFHCGFLYTVIVWYSVLIFRPFSGARNFPFFVLHSYTGGLPSVVESQDGAAVARAAHSSAHFYTATRYQ